VKARKGKASLVQAYRATMRRDSHPHLDPINVAAFKSDCDIAMTKVERLAAYQNFLAAARAAKARRKGVPLAFERNVQRQARQALADLQALSGGVLRVVQQANHTNIWADMLTRATSMLKTTGPVSAKQIWDEVRLNQEYLTALESHGLTAERVAAVTTGISRLDARLVLHAGKVSVETPVAGERAPRRLSLKASPGRPTGIVDLLRRSQFDKVVSAFSRNDPVYLEVVATEGPVDYEPGQVFAVGAVAARQRMAEHVRKLEDTGLATYQGNDPGTAFIALVVIGLILSGVGLAIEYQCERGAEPDPDVCNVGGLLIFLGMMCLGASVSAGYAAGYGAYSLFTLIPVPYLVKRLTDAWRGGFTGSGSPVS
jgi:hypothetical protein